MKIKNYTVFDNNLTKNWDKLRNSQTHTPYFVPFDKNTFLLSLNKYTPNPAIIKDFALLKSTKNINRIVSLCSGSCKLEYHLMKELNLICEVSDNTQSILRIKKFNIFNNAYFLDLNNDFKLNIDQSCVVLLSRIDTEFDDFELIKLFKTLHKNKVKYIYFIPGEILNIKTILIKIKIILSRLMKFKRPYSWGYIRNLNGFKKLWKHNYSIFKKSKNLVILISNDSI